MRAPATCWRRVPAAGAGRVIAQSISWEQAAERGRLATAELERTVLGAGGVVIRYGQFWGPGTFYEDAPPTPPRIHVDATARQTLPALAAPPGVTLVVDDRAAPQAG
ncbi:MAG: hypothetical protein ACR2MP_06780 [Streptosporangiaceae bacterium]